MRSRVPWAGQGLRARPSGPIRAVPSARRGPRPPCCLALGGGTKAILPCSPRTGGKRKDTPQAGRGG
eukprot:scaffold90060_cov30-Tisochrysis_lutea.AAC.1